VIHDDDEDFLVDLALAYREREREGETRTL